MVTRLVMFGFQVIRNSNVKMFCKLCLLNFWSDWTYLNEFQDIFICYKVIEILTLLPRLEKIIAANMELKICCMLYLRRQCKYLDKTWRLLYLLQDIRIQIQLNQFHIPFDILPNERSPYKICPNNPTVMHRKIDSCILDILYSD